MATTRIKDLSKTATTVNSDANLVLDGNTGGTQKISRDNFRQDTADAFVAAPGTYNLAPLNSGTGKIDAVYLSSSSDSPKGAWDASSNTPTLADGTGTAGDYYDVTVAGSSDLGSGSITFTVGDVVKYNGTVWFKIDSVANILDGVSTIDGAKAAIEIPDVGTAPNEVPLNGQLGSMAYQSSEGISVDNLEVTGKLEIDSSGNVSIGAGDIANNGSLHVYRSSATADLNLQSAGGSGRSFAIQSKTNGSLVVRDNNGAADRLTVGSGGHIGIANDSPGSANGSANNLVIGNSTTSTSTGISIVTQPNRVGSLFFANGTSGVSGYVGRVQYDHSTNALTFGVNGMVPWSINSVGNLVASGAYGIDFGSGATLDEYEVGTWTPSYNTSGSGFTNPPTMDVLNARYVRIGDLVTFYCHIQTDSVDLTGAGTYLLVNGLPYAATVSSGGNNVAVNIGYAAAWANAPSGGYVQGGQTYIYLTKRVSSITGNLTEMSPSDLTAGTVANQNSLMISGSYYTTA